MKLNLENAFNIFRYYLKYFNVMFRRYRKSLLALLGLIIFAAYFWNRFLRIRTVKDLPLNLSILGFFIVLYIVFIFAYIVYSLLFQKSSNNIMEKIIDIIFIPIKELDRAFRNLNIIKKYSDKILESIFPLLEFMIIKTDLFFIIFWIFPRLLLLIVLFLDIFLFYKFEYRYKFIFIGLLLLFNRCFKYSLKNIRNEKFDYIDIYVVEVGTEYYPYVHPSELEPDYDPNEGDNADVTPEMALPLKVFLEHQVNSIVYKGVTNNIRGILPTKYSSKIFQLKYLGNLIPKWESLSKEEKDNYKTEFGDYWDTRSCVFKKATEFIEYKIKEIVRISVLLEHYYKTSHIDKGYKTLKILIFLSYLICWLYVLIISFPNIPESEWNKLIVFLNKYKNILEEIWN